MNVISPGASSANPRARRAIDIREELPRIRAALIDRIDAAAERARWGRASESAGMPFRLFAAGCYLASLGFEDKTCVGERWFGCDFTMYRLLASATMVEDGRRAIYLGRRAIASSASLQVAV